MLKQPIKEFKTFGLNREKAIFNQQNKDCFPLFCAWFYVIKEMVYDLACSIELWMHMGSWESAQKSRVALGYRLQQLLHFFVLSHPPASIHNSIEHAKPRTIFLIETRILNAKIFLPSHHVCKWTPHTSRLVPSHRISSAGRGYNSRGFEDYYCNLEQYFQWRHCRRHISISQPILWGHLP